MSDQHAATTLTAAAVIAAILIARAAVLHRTRSIGAPMLRRPHRVMRPGGATHRLAAVPFDEAAVRAVREAEQHVHRCWQQLETHTDPPE